MSNTYLNRLLHGKVADSDEQYTRYEDVDQELRHYTKYLRNKRIYLPCDGPQSMFVKWFKDHPELGCKVVRTSNDYRNPENIQKMREQDIVITNPPFSLCTKVSDGPNIPFIPLLLSIGVDFLIICTELHVKSPRILPYYAKGRVRFGYNKATKFIKPDGSINSVRTGCWLTTLPVNTPALKPTYSKDYRPMPLSKYPRDIRTGAIVIEDVRMLPDPVPRGVLMMVKPTALKYFRPEEYEINPKCTSPIFKNGKEGFQVVVVRRK